ncbi:restriction endonuclease subunit S, partial [Pedobacter miscanthi]
PNLRFPGFEGEWKQSLFGDLCKISTGNKNTQDKSYDGQFPFYVRSSTVERINEFTFDGEAILTAGDGVGVGKVFHYTTGKIGVHQRVYILSDFKRVSGKFLYYYFSSRFFDRVSKLSAKNSVDSVRYDMIAKMHIAFPDIDEQNKIANLVSLIDERIQTQSKI